MKKSILNNLKIESNRIMAEEFDPILSLPDSKDGFLLYLNNIQNINSLL